MQIETLVLGELETNCYLVWNESTNEAIVIDPADSGEFISQRILEEGLTLKQIILTHGHFDHVLGLLELSLNFPEASVLMHQDDLFLIEKAPASAHHWLGREVDPVPPPTQFFTEGDEIRVGPETFQVIETPGHTPGSVCLIGNEIIFTGDTLFKDGVGRTDFKYSDPRQLRASLEKINQFRKNHILYPGHGAHF